MKTICYVDGYNLYYGCLKHTPYKWLDLECLLNTLLHEQNPASDLVLVKYFTADIKAQLSRHGDAAHQAQQDYQRALALRMGERLQIIKGFHSLSKGSMLSYETPASKARRVDVWRLEEKETDVNLALHAYRDAIRLRADQLVFVSNDTDLAPALRAIREEKLNLEVGVVFPILHRSEPTPRPGNATLSALADWTRRHLHATELANAQLPALIPTKRKPIRKPAHW
jgi:uncharacterized LabA/DUF88 family protein